MGREATCLPRGRVDSSDSATQGTQLTDLTVFSSLAQEPLSSLTLTPLLALADDPIQFGQIPRLYWFNDIDIDHAWTGSMIR